MKKSKNLFRIKEVKLAIKHHKSVWDLLEVYDFRDKEEVFELIRARISSEVEANRMIRALDREPRTTPLVGQRLHHSRGG